MIPLTCFTFAYSCLEMERWPIFIQVHRSHNVVMIVKYASSGKGTLAKSSPKPDTVLLKFYFNPLNSELNSICHLLALLGAHHILHVSRIRVNITLRSVTRCHWASTVCAIKKPHKFGHKNDPV